MTCGWAAELNSDGEFANTGSYDLALAKPPYYSGYRIARHFLVAGRAALRPGGTMLLVTKHPDLYVQNMPEWYDDDSLAERSGYYLLLGARPAD